MVHILRLICSNNRTRAIFVIVGRGPLSGSRPLFVSGSVLTAYFWLHDRPTQTNSNGRILRSQLWPDSGHIQPLAVICGRRVFYSSANRQLYSFCPLTTPFEGSMMCPSVSEAHWLFRE